MPDIFDAHLHIVDPRFPLTPNRGFLPDPFDTDDYLRAARPLGVAGGAIVSGSFQAFDQTYLVDALERLGPTFVGVTQLPETVDDATILRLESVGVRAVRFNLRRGGSASRSVLRRFAVRIHELAGWHVELYVDGRELAELEPLLVDLPRAVIDHLGLQRDGLPTLYRLVEGGVHVKATGFGRLDFDPFPVVRRIASIRPTALLFGTDLPSTRAPRPFEATDLETLRAALGPELAERALWRNAIELYRPNGIDPAPAT